MSLDDQAEESAYIALYAIAKIPRPKERHRICMEIIKLAAKVGGIVLIHERGEQGQ